MGQADGTRKETFAAFAFAAVTFLTTGCSTTVATSQGNAAVPKVTQIIVAGKEFKPSVITVPAGTTVNWINRGGEAHTVTSSTGLFSGALGPVSGSFNFTFNQSGSYEYHCDIYDYHVMTGRIDVQ